MTHKVTGVYYLPVTAQYCLSQLPQTAIVAYVTVQCGKWQRWNGHVFFSTFFFIWTYVQLGTKAYTDIIQNGHHNEEESLGQNLWLMHVCWPLFFATNVSIMVWVATSVLLVDCQVHLSDQGFDYWFVFGSSNYGGWFAGKFNIIQYFPSFLLFVSIFTPLPLYIC